MGTGDIRSYVIPVEYNPPGFVLQGYLEEADYDVEDSLAIYICYLQDTIKQLTDIQKFVVIHAPGSELFTDGSLIKLRGYAPALDQLASKGELVALDEPWVDDVELEAVICDNCGCEVSCSEPF